MVAYLRTRVRAQSSWTDHNRPLYISGAIANEFVSRVLVDNGSGVCILPKKTLIRLGYSTAQLKPSHMVIQGYELNEQKPLSKERIFKMDLPERHIVTHSPWITHYNKER